MRMRQIRSLVITAAVLLVSLSAYAGELSDSLRTIDKFEIDQWMTPDGKGKILLEVNKLRLPPKNEVIVYAGRSDQGMEDREIARIIDITPVSIQGNVYLYEVIFELRPNEIIGYREVRPWYTPTLKYLGVEEDFLTDFRLKSGRLFGAGSTIRLQPTPTPIPTSIPLVTPVLPTATPLPTALPVPTPETIKAFAIADFTKDGRPRIIIRWDKPVYVTADDYHLQISVDGSRFVYLGHTRTGETDHRMHYLSWVADSPLIHQKFRNGPEVGHSYKFRIIAIFDENQVSHPLIQTESVSFKKQVVVPTATATDTDTPVPTPTCTSVPPTATPTPTVTSTPVPAPDYSDYLPTNVVLNISEDGELLVNWECKINPPQFQVHLFLDGAYYGKTTVSGVIRNFFLNLRDYDLAGGTYKIAIRSETADQREFTNYARSNEIVWKEIEAIPTPTPVHEPPQISQIPWNWLQVDGWANYFATPSDIRNTHPLSGERVAPDAEVNWLPYLKNEGMMVLTAKGTEQALPAWFEGHVSIDPFARPYFILAIVNDSGFTEGFTMLPGLAWRKNSEDRLAVLYPEHAVVPVLETVADQQVLFLAYDLRRIPQQVYPHIAEGNFLMPKIRYIIQPKSRYADISMSVDYWAFLTPEEASSSWVGHFDEGTRDQFRPMSSEGQHQFVIPDQILDAEYPGREVVIINPNNKYASVSVNSTDR